MVPKADVHGRTNAAEDRTPGTTGLHPPARWSAGSTIKKPPYRNDMKVHFSQMVPKAGLEPARLTPLPPQDSVSTNSTTSANFPCGYRAPLALLPDPLSGRQPLPAAPPRFSRATIRASMMSVPALLRSRFCRDGHFRFRYRSRRHL